MRPKGQLVTNDAIFEPYFSFKKCKVVGCD